MGGCCASCKSDVDDICAVGNAAQLFPADLENMATIELNNRLVLVETPRSTNGNRQFIITSGNSNNIYSPKFCRQQQTGLVAPHPLTPRANNGSQTSCCCASSSSPPSSYSRQMQYFPQRPRRVPQQYPLPQIASAEQPSQQATSATVAANFFPHNRRPISSQESSSIRTPRMDLPFSKNFGTPLRTPLHRLVTDIEFDFSPERAIALPERRRSISYPYLPSSKFINYAFDTDIVHVDNLALSNIAQDGGSSILEDSNAAAVPFIERNSSPDVLQPDSISFVIETKNEESDDDGQLSISYPESPSSPNAVKELSDTVNQLSPRRFKILKRLLSLKTLRDGEELSEETLPKVGEFVEAKVPLKDDWACVVCLTNPKQVVLFPCRHLCCCPPCSILLRGCPMCRQSVLHILQVFT